MERHKKALELIEAVSHQKTDVRRTKVLLAERKQYIAWLNAMVGRMDEAWAESNALVDEWNDLQRDSGFVKYISAFKKGAIRAIAQP